jgi:tRNA dimethylallyltransferase
MKPIILITGPTATGKTRTSINLCKFLIKNNIASEVINFDSLIFYRELNIGSAKPSDEELTSVPHHLINTHSIRTPLNASDYSKLAKGIIHKLHQESIVPILVGGSAFYIRALIKGMYESETTQRTY